MDADGEKNIAGGGQLAQGLALDADEALLGDVAIAVERALLVAGERMVEIAVRLQRPVHAPDRAGRGADCRTCG